MHSAAITGTGVFTPDQTITNHELVVAFNAYADAFNADNAEAIAAGDVEAKTHSSADFILAASGIERRYVLDKAGVLDPSRMSSNMERAYPAIAVEIQQLLNAGGFAFDMNVACSSATFGIQTAADMIKAGSVRTAIVVNPEICSAHLEWRDRDCHFIFGDVATAVVLQREDDATGDYFRVKSTRCATQFSNNIRNNNGFLRRARDQMEDRRDMQFMQNGRKVFKEVLPLVSKHIAEHMADDGLSATDLKRLWLHQANKSMNDYIGKKVLGRDPQAGEQPNILQDYANTSSAGSIIAFSKHSDDLNAGDHGLICSFGAGYSVGSVIVEKC